jgi:hypothetical protein
MQSLVNLDEKIRSLLDLVKKKKEFAVKDKEESLRIITKHFDLINKKLEERKGALFQKVISISE